MSVTMISPRELAALQQQGAAVDLIDVRTPAEFAAVHADGARNVPLDTVGMDCLTAGRRPYVICHSGKRAQQACEKLLAAGCAEVVCVEGGTQAWSAANLPVVRGKGAISLERQVRIIAGLLVLLGVVLSRLHHPGWVLLSGFVGAGLTFAGVTDTCMMASLLAKMPWNRKA